MKNRVRKVTALLIAMLLFLSGCAETEKPVIQEETDITIEEVVEEPVEEVVKEAIPLAVHTTTNQKTYYLNDGEVPYFYLQYSDVSVEGDEFEKLIKNVENWSVERSEELRGVHETFQERAESEAKDNEDFYGYNLYQEVAIARVDEKIVSLLDDTHQYAGGANTTFYREGVNFDAKSGAKLELKDLLINHENFIEDASSRIISELERLYSEELFEDYSDKLIIYKGDENKVLILGGPMMGANLVRDDAVITRTCTSCIILNDKKYVEEPCVRCGSCVYSCPAELHPQRNPNWKHL